MRLLALLAAGLFAGSLLAADDKILKPTPKEMTATTAGPYSDKKVEVKGRLSNVGVDAKSNKWYFHLTLIDDKDKDTDVAIYLFFDDKDAAAGLKENLEALAKDKKVVPVKDRPVAVARGYVAIYGDLDPEAQVPPVILNGTEIVGLKGVEKDEKKAKDEEAILGTWKLEKFETGTGKDPSAEELAKMRFTFLKDGKLVTVDPDGKEQTGVYKLDAAARPKAIDTTVGKRSASVGIYELDGDTLRICFPAADLTRPTEFKADGKGSLVFTFKRVAAASGQTPKADTKEQAVKDHAQAQARARDEYNAAVTTAHEAHKKRLAGLLAAETKGGKVNSALADEYKRLDAGGPPVLAAVDLNPKDQAPARSAGVWVIRYTPDTTRTYAITNTGEVVFQEEKKTAKLDPKALTVDFGDGKLERLTFVGDRVFVEHYPSVNDLDKKHPEHVGIGVRKK